MIRDYQHNYSRLKPSLYNTDKRVRKAETILRVCQDFVGDLSILHALDVGSSNGIIDNHLAQAFKQVTGIDIDQPGIAHAQATFDTANLHFEHGDAMEIPYPEARFDVAVCTQIYEHVPDAQKMLDEIFRVLKPGGFCYFAGNNRLMLIEPHYRLPLLSVIPRPLAHPYLRMAGKGDYYHELHFTRGTLQRMCQKFEIHDYSAQVVANPDKFGVSYMLQPGSAKWRAAKLMTTWAKWASPMIWLLQKPATT